MIVLEYLTEQVSASGVGLIVGSLLGYVIGRVHQHRIQSETAKEEETS